MKQINLCCASGPSIVLPSANRFRTCNFFLLGSTSSLPLNNVTSPLQHLVDLKVSSLCTSNPGYYFRSSSQSDRSELNVKPIKPDRNWFQ